MLDAEPPCSYWMASTTPATRQAVPLPPEVDVAVLGAGIAGLTTAYLLAERDRTVAVIEAGELAAGTSGHTTAKVTAQHGLGYRRLQQQFGPATARAYGESQLAALGWLAEAVSQLGVDCEWEERDSIVYVTEPHRVGELQAEAEVAARLGLPAEFTTDVELPYAVAGAVRFSAQAQFHPRRWLLALAELIEARGGSLHTGVRATSLREGDPCEIDTTAGPIRARDVVVATHYPVFNRGGYFGRLSLTRDLVVAGPVPQAAAPPDMYIAADTGRSIRTAPVADGQRLLIVGGEHYRTGAASDVQRRYRVLAGWAREALGLSAVAYHWSAHDMSTVDGLPYIGRYHPFAKRVWVATGFGAWGMTNGTLAGMILADLVTGMGNRWAGVYDPGRMSWPAALGVLRDNVEVARYLFGGHVESLTGPDVEALRPGTGTVVWRGPKAVAVSRTEDGRLISVSARCTHLGCLVRWNDGERSWDCPCHGSRFSPDGGVLEGPARHPLPGA
jgi:glycine/D-amino acid oxidase-like deaminating enzyme/nitrite reductase/ring-hydroxylating ferredoxin subunit